MFVALTYASVVGAEESVSPVPEPGYGLVHATVPFLGGFSIRSIENRRAVFDVDLLDFGGDFSYGAWVPPGEYTLNRWNASDLEGHGSFLVEAGRATDLGALMGFDVGDFEYMLVPWRHPDSDAAIASAVAHLAEHLDSIEPIRWSAATLPDAVAPYNPSSGLGMVADIVLTMDRNRGRPDAVDALRESDSIQTFVDAALEAMPPTYREPFVTSDGDRYYGAGFGQIRHRSPEGEWQTFDTGSLQRVISVAQDDEHLFAGMEQGLILRSTDGDSWERFSSHPSGYQILDMDRAGDEWIVAVGRTVSRVHLWMDGVEIYRGGSLSFDDLELVQEVDLRGVVNQLFLIQGHVRGGDYFANISRHLYRLNLDSGEWQIIEPPVGPWRYSLADGGDTISIVHWQGVSRRLAVSYDRGETWRQDRLRKADKVHFDASGVGYAFQWRNTGITKGYDVSRFDPERERWSRLYTTPQACMMTLSQPSEDIQLCLTGTHDIIRVDGDSSEIEFTITPPENVGAPQGSEAMEAG